MTDNEPTVPYLRQAVLGSCGPACVEMVRGWLRGEPAPRAGSEMVPWTRSWIFPFGMTESFGLARLLRDVGAEVTVYKERPDFSLRPESGPPFSRVVSVFGKTSAPVAGWRKWRAMGRGVKLVVGPVSLDLLTSVSGPNTPVIAMVNQGVYAPDPDWGEGVLHWVVVTSVANRRVRFHDPDLGPDREEPRDVFERAMDVRPMGIDRQIVVARPEGVSTRDRTGPRPHPELPAPER